MRVEFLSRKFFERNAKFMPKKIAKKATAAGLSSAAVTAINQSYSPRGAYKLKEAAEYIGGVSIPTMHRLIRRGLIHPNRALRHIIFSREELDRFVNGA
jgi:ribosomal protein S20